MYAQISTDGLLNLQDAETIKSEQTNSKTTTQRNN
jgi:hypothetical protein